MTSLRNATAMCGALLLPFSSMHAQTAMSLSAPVELQVCQRTDRNQADVVIAGSVNQAVDIVEVKAELAAGITTGEAVGWTTLAEHQNLTGGKFSGKLPLKAGGWYVISVRGRNGEEVVAQATVQKVGVGEVFVTAGQSNSANFGKPKQVAKDDRVVYFKGRDYVPAKDPIPGGCGRDGSPWPILGDLIAGSQQVPVCFRSATPTWAAVEKWMPGVQHKSFHLYDSLVGRVRELPKGGIRAILWHQGESDSLAKTPAETYRDRLKTIIESLNKDAGYDIPWFVAKASLHSKSEEPEEKEVARGQELLWKEGIAKRGPDTDELGPEYRSDKVHFNQKGLTAHAERWFKALADEYKWRKE
ncbi:MAG TPA: sialate O-acetylesterase [Luteolibacter sp.]|nr:sialate O-acetylesterase [Luteolibacter sp.]